MKNVHTYNCVCFASDTQLSRQRSHRRRVMCREEQTVLPTSSQPRWTGLPRRRLYRQGQRPKESRRVS